MNTVLKSILDLIYVITDILQLVLIIRIIISWLIAFDIVNSYSRVVATIDEVTHKMTEPFLAPIRRLMPNLGGLDFSPIVMLLGLYFVQRFIMHLSMDLMGA